MGPSNQSRALSGPRPELLALKHKIRYFEPEIDSLKSGVDPLSPGIGSLNTKIGPHLLKRVCRPRLGHQPVMNPLRPEMAPQA